MLYIVGCSYSIDCYWPKFLEIDFVNYSEPGAGNQYIYTVVNQLELKPGDKVIVQFSEFERIDLILDSDSAFNSLLNNVPSIRRRDLQDCVAWCTGGPRGAWNNNSYGKKYLASLMREYYSNHSQKQNSFAYVTATSYLLSEAGVYNVLFLTKDQFLKDKFPTQFPYPAMAPWAQENNYLDDDNFHLNTQGNKLYYEKFIKLHVQEV